MPKRITHEQFVERIKIKSPNIRIIGEYVNSTTKLPCQCLVCEHEWNPCASDLSKGTGCPKCSRKRQTKSHEDFILEMKTKHPTITILGKYVNAKTRVLCECKTCRHEWNPQPYSLSQGGGCPKCGNNIKKTQEEFVLEIETKNPNIKILGNYVSNQTKVLCKCKVCEHEFTSAPKHLIQGHGCSKCAKNYKRTHKEFVGEMKTINPDIEIVGEYGNNRIPILSKCHICAYEWKTSPSHLLDGTGCPKCNNNYTRTHKEFVEEVKAKNPNVEFLEEFKDTSTKILCKCTVCENEWKAHPPNLIKGHGCIRCANVHKRTHEEFLKELKAINAKIEVLGTYENRKTKLLCKCRVCGCKWNPTPSDVIQGGGCPKCGNVYRKSHEEFVVEVKTKQPTIEVIGKYVNANTKILCHCKVCGSHWKATGDSLTQGHGCPRCKESRGEKSIAQILDKYLIPYIRQHKFDDCIHKRRLPFDFYLPERRICIEYDGMQHEIPIKYFGGKHAFEKMKIRDAIKNNYCEANNIKLIRVSYKIEDVETYLLEQLDHSNQKSKDIRY